MSNFVITFSLVAGLAASSHAQPGLIQEIKPLPSPQGVRATAEKPKGEKPGDWKAATLDKALETWIALLEADKVEAAQKQWAKDDAASGTIKQWWTNVRDCHKKYDYRKWLEQAKQIGDATEFKVGGHDYGFMHVDWEKSDQGWRIATVWMCR